MYVCLNTSSLLYPLGLRSVKHTFSFFSLSLSLSAIVHIHTQTDACLLHGILERAFTLLALTAIIHFDAQAHRYVDARTLHGGLTTITLISTHVYIDT